jgi:hypothetical protein
VKIFNATLGLMLILLGAIASDSALAGRGGHSGHSGRSGHFGHSGGVAHSGHSGSHGHGGIFLVAPGFAPLSFYYPPPGYYPPLPASPPVYIEQDPAQFVPMQEPYYWYYCAASNMYYPYVDSCPGGWQQVVPDTPPPS